MIANYVPNTAKRGGMTLDSNKPFTAQDDFEEAFLYHMHDIGTTLEELQAIAECEIDNPVVIQLHAIEKTISDKLDAVVNELRLLRERRGTNAK